MIDVHAHFAEEGYDVCEELNKIRSAGVNTLVLASDSVLHSQMHATMSEEEGVYFTAGVHPSNTDDFCEGTVSALKELCCHRACVAVGEIGLDYHYEDTNKGKQRAAFIRQILLADELGLPVQIHSRDSAADMLAILREMKGSLSRGFLLHCYSHGAEMMDDFLALGGYFSFGGVLTFKNGRRTVESAKRCPQNRILTETDSPYLSPFRGEKNTPANVPVILRKMAELRGDSLEQLEEAIERNARTLFPKIK